MSTARSGPASPAGPCRHIVQFYESTPHLARAVAEFFAGGMAEDAPCLMIGTREHCDDVTGRLEDIGLNTSALHDPGRMRFVDARDALAQFMIGAEPDEARFRSAMGGLLTELEGEGGRSVHAFGEMVDLLWKDGNPTGAIRLEELWDDLAHDRRFTLLCAYEMGNFRREADGASFERICELHARVLPAEGLPRAITEAPSGTQIALLQQRSRALEHEIAEREKLERSLRAALEEGRQSEARLREREHDLRDFLENGVEGLHCVGPDGRILWANRAELQLMGYEEEEYVGRHIADFHVDAEVIGGILDDLHAGKSVREREARLRRKDGSVRTVLINSNVLWREGTFAYTRCFTRDITDRKHAEEALIRARDEAEAASRAKSEFLAVMSHELRTPLNAILGYQDLLNQEVAGPVTPRQRTYFAHIQEAAQQLLRLIEQVLSLSPAERATLDLDLEPVDVFAIVHDVGSHLEPVARQKGLELRVDTPAGPTRWECDAEKVRRIVLNLVSNAVKFTEAGRVEVRARNGGRSLILEVADTGPGIAAEDRERIFEPFVQIDESPTRKHGGPGLGLTVSRSLARALGGEVTVTSTVGAGSVFTLELPSPVGDGDGR
jgi:PAS domain S-box-containing protein